MRDEAGQRNMDGVLLAMPVSIITLVNCFTEVCYFPWLIIRS